MAWDWLQQREEVGVFQIRNDTEVMFHGYLHFKEKRNTPRAQIRDAHNLRSATESKQVWNNMVLNATNFFLYHIRILLKT